MKNFPLINFVILFCLGIVAEYYFKFIDENFLYLLFALLLLSKIIFLIKKLPARIFILNSLLFFLIFLSGAIHYYSANSSEIKYPFKEPRVKKAMIFGTVEEVKLPSDKKLSFVISSDSISSNSVTHKIDINLLCNAKDLSRKRKNKFLEKLKPGNEILISGTIYKPRNRRNPGEFDYEEYLKRIDISALFSIGKKDSIILERNSPNLLSYVTEVRQSVYSAFKKSNSQEAAAFLKGVLLADRGEISFETREKFVNAGVIHILAVSGLHVGFIILIFVVISSRFNLYLRSFITIAGLLFFLLLTDSPASVTRASIMGIVLIIAFLSGRNSNSFNSLAIAALIILIAEPAEILNPGFQLSFSAVLAIVSIAPIFQRYVKRLKIKNNFLNYVLLFSGVSLAAQLGTLPFTILYFNKISIVALFANLLVIPLVGIIVATGITTLIIYPISEWAAGIYGAANDFFINALYAIVDFSGTAEFSHIKVFEFNLFDTLLFYLSLLFVFIFFKKMSSLKSRIIFLFLVGINFSLFLGLTNNKLLPEGKLSIVGIDIGQGDATLIKFPNGKAVLVDAGNATPTFDNGSKIVLPLLERMGIDSINIGFITHTDADHYKGFLSLFEKGIIKKVYKPSLDTTLRKDIFLDSLIKATDIPLTYYHNDLLNFGDVKFYVLNDSLQSKKINLSTNDNSGVFKIVYGETSFLLTGDAGFKTEKFLINKFGSFLKSDLLKIGHHGSKHSTSDKFLDVVNPELGLISAGVINRFNHPTGEVLEKLKTRNIKIQRTDKAGAIIYHSDGKEIKIIDWRD